MKYSTVICTIFQFARLLEGGDGAAGTSSGRKRMTDGSANPAKRGRPESDGSGSSNQMLSEGPAIKRELVDDN